MKPATNKQELLHAEAAGGHDAGLLPPLRVVADRWWHLRLSVPEAPAEGSVPGHKQIRPCQE